MRLRNKRISAISRIEIYSGGAESVCHNCNIFEKIRASLSVIEGPEIHEQPTSRNYSSFDTLKRQNCLMVDSTNSFNPTNINNSKESFQAESFISPHNRCSSSATPNCSSEDIQHKEYDSNKRRRLDDANKTENTHCHFTGQTSHTTNDVCTGGVINQNSPAIFSFWNRNTIENAIKFPGHIQIVLPLEPINIVRFDYSENYMIRSMYLDEFNNVKTSKKEINIQDITNSNIDSSLFEECIYVLRYGWNCNFLGIKKENFLNLISLIYDLKC
ncbi:hypothetical protein CWI36_1957p0010, partial [Hamiltosporidium magnivora]